MKLFALTHTPFIDKSLCMLGVLEIRQKMGFDGPTKDGGPQPKYLDPPCVPSHDPSGITMSLYTSLALAPYGGL